MKLKEAIEAIQQATARGGDADSLEAILVKYGETRYDEGFESGRDSAAEEQSMANN